MRKEDVARTPQAEDAPRAGSASPAGAGAAGGQDRPGAQRRRRRREPQGQVKAGADFWIRLLARVIDLLLHYVLMFVAMFCGGIFLGILIAAGVVGEPDFDRLAEPSALGFLLALVAYSGYHVIAEGFGGATVGKLICGLRVISQEKGPCRLGPAVLRSICYFVDGLFFGVIGYVSMSDSKLRQRYGDKWAGTMVVKSGLAPAEAKRSGIGVALALAGAAAFSTTVSFISFLIQLLGQ